MIVLVKKDSEFGDTIATFNINGNTLIKHVKEQIEAITGIHKARQSLLKRFDNGRVEKLWQLHGHGKVSSYLIKDGSILVLRCKRREGTHFQKVFGRGHGPAAFAREQGKRKAKHGPAKQHVDKKQRVAALALSESNTLSAPLEP